MVLITNKNTEKKKRGRPAKEGGKRWVELNPSPFVKKLALGRLLRRVFEKDLSGNFLNILASSK